MSKFISNYLSKLFNKIGIIDNSEIESYCFLFDFLFSSVTFDLSILLIGFFLKCNSDALIYLIITTPIRYFAGGFHAKTRFLCNILSYSSFFIVVLLNNLIIINNSYAYIAIYVISIITIYYIAPVDSPNNRLNLSEKKSLKRKLLFFFICLSILFYFLYKKSSYNYIKMICICVTISDIWIYIGYIDNWRHRNGNKNCNM